MKITEINAIENAVVERDATAQEIAQKETDLTAFGKAKEKEQAQLVAKEAAREAVLTKLGLTLEEVQALLG